MCIKSLKHRRNDILNLQCFKESKRINSLKRAFSELTKSKKDLENELCKFYASRSEELQKRSAWYSEYAENMKSLDSQLFSITKQIDDLREETQANRANEQESIDQRIRWLMVELDSGGNIRMEAGSIERTWFKNCIELVTSRFSSQDFAPFGIVGVAARKVTRIHNRFLQDRFEKHTENKVRRRHMEYLLYGETFRGQEELQHIIEEGFPYTPQQSVSDFYGPVLLSNSIGLADMCRLQAISDQLKESKFTKFQAKGWLLIVKAYLGVCVEDHHVGTEFVIVTRSSYPDVDSVYRIHPSDPTQRSWYIFDSSKLVPEYLVEFKYIYKNETSTRGCSLSQTNKVVEDGKTSFPSNEFLQGLYLNAERPSQDRVAVLQSSKHFDKVWSLNSQERCYICNILILKETPISDLSKITHLNLHNSSILELEPLRALCNLEVLILSFNKISHIGDKLEGLHKLEVLDLSYNLLKQIDGLGCLESLFKLDISGNQLSAINDLLYVLFQVPRLLQLNLRCNPVEEYKSYKEEVLKSLSCLTELDCAPVDAVSTSFLHMQSPLEPNVTKCKEVICSTILEFSRRSSSKEQMNPLAGIHSPVISKEQQMGNLYVDDDTEELHLEHQHLKSMLCFGNLSSLRKLFLSGNKIVKLEGLQNLTLLEELILEDNCINQVRQTTYPSALWKLELGRNELVSCLQLSCFSGLTQLSIERNKIASLKGLGSLLSLMELYAAHNRLADVSEISNIRSLPKLMVLDLSGNQLCETSDYRSFTIFTLRKLKVFDGTVVGDNELAEARERHMGRLTRNMLEEFMGINAFDNITILDLSGKSLRNCGKVFESEDLLRLQELNLGHNFLTSINPLKLLQNLQKLELQSNNIGEGPLLEDNNNNATSWTYSINFNTREEGGTDECAVPEKQGALLRASLDQRLCLHKLEILQLDKNSIFDIKSLKLQQSCPSLRLLSLKSNIIAKIDGLSGLTFLQKLYLDHNRIKTIEPCSFEGLPNLEELHLSDNTIKTAKNMEGLSSLKSLNLATNYLMADELGGLPCIELTCLSRLQDLTLSENPICRHPHYRCAVISMLGQLARLDGEDITEDQLLDAEMYMERTFEAVALERDIFSPMELQGLHSTASHVLNGKVALKITPFNFEAMSMQPATYCHTPGTATSCSQGTVHRSLDLWDLDNMRSHGGVHRLTTPYSKGERRHMVPLVLMKSFCRVKEKPREEIKLT